MQSARFDRTASPPVKSQGPDKTGAVPNPNAGQAAAYIYDMSSTLRNLAVQHNLTTLALLLEMAAVEAGSLRNPHA